MYNSKLYGHLGYKVSRTFNNNTENSIEHKTIEIHFSFGIVENVVVLLEKR